MAKDEINAFLGSGTSYEGKLSFQGTVRVDGAFQGEILSDGTLVVGQDAQIEGSVFVGQLVLSGNVKGEVVVREKAVLHKTAVLVGVLRSPLLVMEEGAVLDGQIVMSAPDNIADTESNS